MEIVKFNRKNKKKFQGFFPDEDAAILEQFTVMGYGLLLDGEPAGAILVDISPEEHDAEIISLAVSEEYRGNSYEDALLQEMEKELRELEIRFLTVDLIMPEAVSAYAFYTANNFFDERTIFNTYRLSSEKLRSFLEYEKSKGPKNKIAAVLGKGSGITVPFKKLDTDDLNRVTEVLAKGYAESDPYRWKTADPEFSLVLMRNHALKAVILVNQESPTEYAISFMNCVEKAKPDSAVLLVEALNRFSTALPDGVDITFSIVTEESERILQAFMKDALPEMEPKVSSGVRLYHYLSLDDMAEWFFDQQ